MSYTSQILRKQNMVNLLFSLLWIFLTNAYIYRVAGRRVLPCLWLTDTSFPLSLSLTSRTLQIKHSVTGNNCLHIYRPCTQEAMETKKKERGKGGRKSSPTHLICSAAVIV